VIRNRILQGTHRPRLAERDDYIVVISLREMGYWLSHSNQVPNHVRDVPEIELHDEATRSRHANWPAVAEPARKAQTPSRRTEMTTLRNLDE
jgi:hypothetical protein